MLTIIVSVLLSIHAQSYAGRQEPKLTPACPVITVSCPETVDEDETMTCSANISGDRHGARFRWKVSKGAIIKGQETASIDVDIRNLLPGQIETLAEVLGEWPYSCPRQAVAVSVRRFSDPGPELFNKYGDIPFEKEKEHLHQLALLLRENPGSQPYILVYAGRRAHADEAADRGARAKAFLVENYAIEIARIVVVDGGFRETPCVEFWLVPSGAAPPVATPTVAAKDVKVLNGKWNSKN